MYVHIAEFYVNEMLRQFMFTYAPASEVPRQLEFKTKKGDCTDIQNQINKFIAEMLRQHKVTEPEKLIEAATHTHKEKRNISGIKLSPRKKKRRSSKSKSLHVQQQPTVHTPHSVRIDYDSGSRKVVVSDSKSKSSNSLSSKRSVRSHPYKLPAKQNKSTNDILPNEKVRIKKSSRRQKRQYDRQGGIEP
eukprot:TRINITY_DN3862_c0_g1_i2.p1 TRINITY_DN3862_c0_g1~~TRINITY_DN3862_c0_g1_i2.p1  ORF type:complete len:190 (+),score=18.28 TRINITY_DN3862_c0_g1_i2:244-813(+)